MLDRLLTNWPLKLLAMALAFAIWVSVTGETRIVQDFSVPLELQLSESKVLSSTLPTTVTVRLRGSQGQMRRLDSVPMVLRVNLRSAPVGEQDVQISSRDLDGVPRGVEVDFIDPDRLSLLLDERLSVELPIEPTFIGQPPEGYAFYGARVQPESVLVEGPRSQLEPLELLRTNPIRLDNRTEPFVVRVTAVPEDSYVRMLDPRSLEVHVDIDASPVERSFEEVPVVVRGGTAGDEVDPAAVSVILSGPPALINSLLPEHVAAVADVSELQPGMEHVVQVQVDFAGVAFEDQARINVKSIGQREVKVKLAGQVI
jgi:YbbR domain-containing protein